jgi:hypothetical protein
VNVTTDLPRSQSDTARAFVVAWVFSLAFYFLEYAVRSSPAVMIPQLAKTFGVSTLGVSDILGTYYCTYSTAISVADVGAAGINAEGEVYNLTSPADLAGNYSAVTAGMTIIEGGSVAYLKNEKGVVIKLHSQTGGLRFNLSANGMHITL